MIDIVVPINFADMHTRGDSCRELIPRGHGTLTMAAPWCKEHDEPMLLGSVRHNVEFLELLGTEVVDT